VDRHELEDWLQAEVELDQKSRTVAAEMWGQTSLWIPAHPNRMSIWPLDLRSAASRNSLKCDRADLAHSSHTNPTETNRNRTCEKQNEFGYINRGVDGQTTPEMLVRFRLGTSIM